MHGARLRADRAGCKMITEKLYEFSIRTDVNEVIVWTHLTKREATLLHALAVRINPLRSTAEVVQFEWKEMA